MKEFEKYKRNSVFSPLKDYDYLSKEHAYIEVTEWKNGEGVDINIYNHSEQTMSLGHGEFKLIKKIIKELNK